MGAIQLAFNGIKCRGVWGCLRDAKKGCAGTQGKGEGQLGFRGMAGVGFHGSSLWDFVGCLYSVLFSGSNLSELSKSKSDSDRS